MHTDLLALGFAIALGGAALPQGAITAVTVEAPAGQTEVVVTVRGNNPCGAVTVDHGDGTAITHALVALPTTVSHQYTKAGQYTVKAHGNGNCGGEATTTIQVQPSHVRAAPAPEKAPEKGPTPLAAMDAIDLNNDGRLSLDEWKGTDAVFRALDQNGDSNLSRTEVEDGAIDVFASLDVNNDRRVSTSEWRTSRQRFEAHDRNGDGFVTPQEFGVPAGSMGGAGRRAGAGRGEGNTVVVRGSEAWTDTGIVVRPGQMLTFTASGSIRMSQDANDVSVPAGAKSGRKAANAPVPDAPAGALIARVGDSAPIVIGDQSTPVRMPGVGRLYLGINDDHVGDNAGMYRVTISQGR